MRLTPRGRLVLSALLVAAALVLGGHVAPADWTAPQVAPAVFTPGNP